MYTNVHFNLCNLCITASWVWPNLTWAPSDVVDSPCVAPDGVVPHSGRATVERPRSCWDAMVPWLLPRRAEPLGTPAAKQPEGTETVGATFAMRWRDGMEGEGGGAAGTAASVATKIIVAKMVASRETSSKTQEKSLGNSWILLDLISPSYLGVWEFPSNKQSHAPFLAPASAPEAFFATELAAALILGVSRCLADTKGNWSNRMKVSILRQPMWSQPFTLNMFEEQFNQARALATI